MFLCTKIQVHKGSYSSHVAFSIACMQTLLLQRRTDGKGINLFLYLFPFPSILLCKSKVCMHATISNVLEDDILKIFRWQASQPNFLLTCPHHLKIKFSRMTSETTTHLERTADVKRLEVCSLKSPYNCNCIQPFNKERYALTNLVWHSSLFVHSQASDTHF